MHCDQIHVFSACVVTVHRQIADGTTFSIKDASARSVCPCGGPGIWRRIAFLSMSNASEECPPNWTRMYVCP